MRRRVYIMNVVDTNIYIPIGLIPPDMYWNDQIPEGYIELKGQSIDELDDYPKLQKVMRKWGMSELPNLILN